VLRRARVAWPARLAERGRGDHRAGIQFRAEPA
jgi:hypothetical protein